MPEPCPLPEDLTRLFEAVDRLDLKQRLSVGLTEGTIRKARAALDSQPIQGEQERDAAPSALLQEALDAVHRAVHRGGADRQLTDEILAVAKQAGALPMDPPVSS